MWRKPLQLSEAAKAFLSQSPPREPLPRLSNLIGRLKYPAAGSALLDAECFTREDEADDSIMYARPILCTHIDDEAIVALTKHYQRTLPATPTGNDVALLDLCSSWVSFLPDDFTPARCVGLGMNAIELGQNTQLTERVVCDLNKGATLRLPFEDASFDAVTNVVSVDYITRPLALFAEMHRVLKPGGVALMSFSNRMFWHKAVRIWTESTEWQRVLLCSLYFRQTHGGGGFEALEAMEVTEPDGNDPLYIVQARKPRGGGAPPLMSGTGTAEETDDGSMPSMV